MLTAALVLSGCGKTPEVINPNPSAHLPGCRLVNYIDQIGTDEDVHKDFYEMHKSMKKLWLLENPDERDKLAYCKPDTPHPK